MTKHYGHQVMFNEFHNLAKPVVPIYQNIEQLKTGENIFSLKELAFNHITSNFNKSWSMVMVVVK